MTKTQTKIMTLLFSEDCQDKRNKYNRIYLGNSLRLAEYLKASLWLGCSETDILYVEKEVQDLYKLEDKKQKRLGSMPVTRICSVPGDLRELMIPEAMRESTSQDASEKTPQNSKVKLYLMRGNLDSQGQFSKQKRCFLAWSSVPIFVIPDKTKLYPENISKLIVYESNAALTPLAVHSEINAPTSSALGSRVESALDPTHVDSENWNVLEGLVISTRYPVLVVRERKEHTGEIFSQIRAA